MERCLKNFNNSIYNIKDFDNLFMSVAPKNWMLVHDSSYQFLPERIRNVFSKHKYNCVEFDDFSSNPTYESVLKGVSIYNQLDCSLIVAVGGGSTIDVAKCIKLFSHLNTNIFLINQIPNYSFINQINLVALPTTAGTGSESTKHAVIYYNGVKQSICDDEIVPDVVILDESVLCGLPILHKKGAMLDALCQACESWWSNSANEKSIGYSKQAIINICGNWKSYIFSNDSNAAREVLLSANNAGRAINITKTTAAHAMSYKLSSMYNIPHGIAVALCFPIVWKHMLEKADDKLKEKFDEIASCFGKQNTFEAIQCFETMLCEMNIEYPVSNNREIDIELLADSVNPERLSNNPIIFAKDELKEMYEEIIK